MPEREEIHDDCWLCRLVERPKDYEDDGSFRWQQSIFAFPGRNCESHVWRMYAKTDSDVHKIGRETTAAKNRGKDGREEEYSGFLQAEVIGIREIRHSDEHEEIYGLSVDHDPWVNGEYVPYHSHVCFLRIADGEIIRPPRPIRQELRALLALLFENSFVSADSGKSYSGFTYLVNLLAHPVDCLSRVCRRFLAGRR